MRTVRMDGPRGLRLRVRVPESRRERMRGLIDRRPLPPNEALLLERTRSVHTFGMRSAITAALLDQEHVVRGVVNLPPRRVLLPRRDVRHVLELDEQVDVRQGDRLTFATCARPYGRL